MHGSSWYTTPNKNIVFSCLTYPQGTFGISWYNLNYLENVDVHWYKTTNKNIILSYIDTHKEHHARFVMVYPAGIRLVIKILHVLFSSLILL